MQSVYLSIDWSVYNTFICSLTDPGTIRLFVHWLVQMQSVYLSIDWSRCDPFIYSLTDPGAIRLFVRWLIQIQSVYLSIDWSRYNPFIVHLYVSVTRLHYFGWLTFLNRSDTSKNQNSDLVYVRHWHYLIWIKFMMSMTVF